MAADDKTLMRRVKKGDRVAFETIVSRHQGTVYGYLRARLLQPDDAEDLTQEVFLRFYEARRRFDERHRIRPWLMGIARNLLREYVRKVRRTRMKEVAWTEMCLEVDDVLRVREEDGFYEDAMQHLPGCIDSLGQSARTAIDLRYASKLNLAAIGERLRRSEGAVKLLMFRARQALKRCLNGKLGAPPHDE